MKKNIILSILLLAAMQVFALPNLIGRWQTAPMWDGLEKTEVELNFLDSVNFDAKVVVDNTEFSEGTRTTMTMRWTYQMRDSLCIFSADLSTFTAIPAPLPGRNVTDLNNVDSLIIRPSHNSEDVMAVVFDSGREVNVLYRQK
ncbi:MAG: hypothetical protein SPK97_00680 [Bacteroidales bacterium]|nr:hypothetical protein [Bacteroidales bacterium]